VIERSGRVEPVRSESVRLELESFDGPVSVKDVLRRSGPVKAGEPILELEGKDFERGLEDLRTQHADATRRLEMQREERAMQARQAVAGVQRVRNPILLAEAVMQHSPHVMMVGQGAEAFATGQGITLVDPSYFRTDKRWQQLQKALKEEASGQAHADLETARHFGTVGAVALDKDGRLAAGTSTGGMTNKRYGRVGDSPIIGAGTYADAGCAVSGTGWGEYYIRTAAAHDICARMRYLKQGPEEAGRAVINERIPALGGDGGAIVLAADGRVATPFNTQGMYRGWIGADGVPHVAIFASETLPLPGQ
jgi:beta-aspartyl-peptidase (threonine type)